MAPLKLSEFLVKQRRWQSLSFLPEKGSVSISWLMYQGKLSGPHHILTLKRILLFFSPFLSHSKSGGGNQKAVLSLFFLLQTCRRQWRRQK